MKRSRYRGEDSRDPRKKKSTVSLLQPSSKTCVGFDLMFDHQPTPKRD